MAEAEQRPGSKMYGGNIDLVSRRENVQVVACNFCGGLLSFKTNFFLYPTGIRLVKVSIRIVDVRENHGDT